MYTLRASRKTCGWFEDEPKPAATIIYIYIKYAQGDPRSRALHPPLLLENNIAVQALYVYSEYARERRHRNAVYNIWRLFTVPVRANRKSTSGRSGGGFARLYGSYRPPAGRPRVPTIIIIIRERHKLTWRIYDLGISTLCGEEPVRELLKLALLFGSHRRRLEESAAA